MSAGVLTVLGALYLAASLLMHDGRGDAALVAGCVFLSAAAIVRAIERARP